MGRVKNIPDSGLTYEQRLIASARHAVNRRKKEDETFQEQKRQREAWKQGKCLSK